MIETETSGGKWRAALRFLLSGGFNTLVTWAIYALLLQVLPYRWSYTIAYLAGIALAYWLYRYYVFDRKARRFGPLWVALIYLLQYGLGLALVGVWIQFLAGPAVWAPIFAVAISLPLTFALNTWVFPNETGEATKTT